MKIAIFLAVAMLTSSSGIAATVVGTNVNVTGSASDTILTFTPQLGYLNNSNQLANPVPYSVKTSGGVFSRNLIGNLYRVSFANWPSTNWLALVPPNDTNVYTLLQCFNFATNPAYSYTNYAPIQLTQTNLSVVAASTSVAINTNSPTAGTFIYTPTVSSSNLVYGLTNTLSISTNFTIADSQRVITRGISFYGNNRGLWPKTISTINTNGPLRLWFVGNGWAVDGIMGAVATNMFPFKPFAGYGTQFTMTYPGTLSFGPFSGLDTATYQDPYVNNGFYTNYIKPFFVLETNNSIVSPITAYGQPATLVADVLGVSYLANPTGGLFVLEYRTNAAVQTSFLDPPGPPWYVLGSTINATNAGGWVGKTTFWTNTTPCITQIRVRSTTAGFVPIVDFCEWNSQVASNGTVVGLYAQLGGPSVVAGDKNCIYPIWANEKPTLVLITGGFNDSIWNSLGQPWVSYFQSGYTNSDLVEVVPQQVGALQTGGLEPAYCFTNSIPYFNGDLATVDAWGSFSNAVSLGYYDPYVEGLPHMSLQGYQAFSEMLVSWLGLTQEYRH